MQVIKRNGKFEDVKFDKISQRIKNLCNLEGFEKLIVDPIIIAQKMCDRITDQIHTSELDKLCADIAVAMSIKKPEYGELASRLVIDDHQKNTSEKIEEVFEELKGFLDENVVKFVMENKDEINESIDFKRDFNINYFGFKTLCRGYLLKNCKDKIIERPQHMWMRVSICLHWENGMDEIVKSYEQLSNGFMIHGTPTLFHSGAKHPQLSSCFLYGTEDSVGGIFKTISDTAKISKWAGGVGLHVSNIRAADSKIKGTNGKSDGIFPMIKVYNDVSRYINQCFVPETIIYTLKGPKQIKDVTTDDDVLTKDGTFQMVNSVIKNVVKKKVYKMKNELMDDHVKCTAEHEIFVWKRGADNPAFSAAKNIEVGDLVCYPKPKEEKNTFYSTEFCRFVGVCYNFSNIINDGKDQFLDLTGQTPEIVEFTKGIFKGRNIEIKDGKAIWNLKYLSLPSLDTVIHLPKRKLEAFLTGVVSIKPGDEQYFKYMLLRQDDRFHLENPRFNVPFTFASSEFTWVKVIEKEEEDYEGQVYDLNIIDNHNYTTEFGLVHNSGKRNGSFAIYLEPWHADIFDFLEAKRIQGAEERRARDLFYALWIPDLFMERVKEGGIWSLMSPDDSPGLADVYGDKFKALYEKYEAEGKFRKQVNARDVWDKIIATQIETGTPYMCFKRAFNEKSNQQNLGTIKSSNLCVEIGLYSDDKEYAVCNVGSVSLPSFVEKYNGKEKFIYRGKQEDPFTKKQLALLKRNNVNFTFENSETNSLINENTRERIDNLWGYFKPKFNFEKLRETTKQMTKNLDRVIDVNYYPVPETRITNMKNRPLGIGAQGLADVFAMLRISFESEEARELNELIFAHMYQAALEASIELAKIHGPYQTFLGSPISDGQFQFNLWGFKDEEVKLDGWEELRQQIKKHGIRNSTLLALMPTGSTAGILGNTESFEPCTNNLYMRRVLAGEFPLINKYLIERLQDEGVWRDEMIERIIHERGSLQKIPAIYGSIKHVFKTVWEISQKKLLQLSADRGKYICQSQSQNIYFENPTYELLTSALFFGWSLGLKTGSYYIRQKAVSNAQAFTICPEKAKQYAKENEQECLMCSG